MDENNNAEEELLQPDIENNVNAIVSEEIGNPMLAGAIIHIRNAQLSDLYPNHIIPQPEEAFTTTKFISSNVCSGAFIACLSVCLGVVLVPIAEKVSYKGLEFTIPAMISCSVSMILKILLADNLEFHSEVYFLSERGDLLVTILVPLLFLITCTPYDYLINLHAARERNSTHNHNGHDVLTHKFVFISLFAFIASFVLIRFNRLNLSMVYNRRAFKYQNCAVIVVEERRYPKLNEVKVGKIQIGIRDSTSI